MAKLPSDENDPTQPKDTENMSLEEPILDHLSESNSTESGAPGGAIAQEVFPDQAIDDFKAKMREEDSEIADGPDNHLKDADDVLGEELDKSLEGDPGDGPDRPLVETLDANLKGALDKEQVVESEPTIEVEPSPYFPRGIYEDAWSVEAYYGRERPIDMDQTQAQNRKKMAALAKKRLRILLVAIAFILILSLIALVVTGRIYLPF